MNDASILLVEDDLGVQAFIARVLRLEGASVATASTGREALSRVTDARRYNLIVLDLCLPDMIGWDVLDGIRLIYPSQEACPVVILTAMVDENSRRLAAGRSVGFLAKPIGAKDLVTGLRPFVRRDA
ncbi:MAG: response regulator [Chloroflexi bacterium]|nr:response regulator [Chloroflexota bacterium]